MTAATMEATMVPIAIALVETATPDDAGVGAEVVGVPALSGDGAEEVGAAPSNVGMGVTTTGAPVGADVTVGEPVGLSVGGLLGATEDEGADVVGEPDGIREGMSDGMLEGDPVGESEGASVGASVVKEQLSKEPGVKNSKTLPEGTAKSSSHKSYIAPASTLEQSKDGTDWPTLGPEVQFCTTHEEHMTSLTVTAQPIHMVSSLSSSVSQSSSANVTVSFNPFEYMKLSER
jgi:hypothetical protein